MNNTFCVYKHTNIINGKVYIGQTKNGTNPYKRWGHNGWGYVNCSAKTIFSKAINKYGWENFKHEILYNNLTQEEANYYEELEIKNHKSTELKYGYNQIDGGRNSLRVPEVGYKISASLKDYYNKHPITKEVNLKRGESIKKFWANPENNYKKLLKREKISKSLTGTKYNLNPKHTNSNKGRIKVNNGLETKSIYPEELDYYLNNGWVKGYKYRDMTNLINSNKNRAHHKQEVQ